MVAGSVATDGDSDRCVAIEIVEAVATLVGITEAAVAGLEATIAPAVKAEAATDVTHRTTLRDCCSDRSPESTE